MTDVTIRGAGIFGLSIAWTALRRGARVRVIDPGGVAAGASGGVVGALAPHTPDGWNPKKAFQRDSLLAAPAFWSTVAQVSGQDPAYARDGRVQPLADGRAVELAESRILAAQQTWGDSATWSVTDDPGDFAPASATGLWLTDTASAHLHPARATAALAAAFRARGGEIVPDGAPRGPVIWATGAAGLAALSEGRARPVGQGIKGQAALLRYDARGHRQVFVDGLHIVPHTDGTVAIGSTTEREFEDATGTDALLDDVILRARRAMPVLSDAPVIQRWAGLRPRARSRAPVLGHWPDRPGHFIANGGFKIGFGVAIGVAEVMCDLVLDGVDRIPAGFTVAGSL